jgi:hypothetical protein
MFPEGLEDTPFREIFWVPLNLRQKYNSIEIPTPK